MFVRNELSLRRIKQQVLTAAFAVLFLFSRPSTTVAQWTQWGGPKRDFIVPTSTGLAAEWPKEGPKKIWSRPLGEGYSSILVDGARLYTMYRTGDDEVVTALDAETGKTIWEHKYPAPIYEGMDPQFGKGPNATPLLEKGRLYTVGVAGHVYAFNADSGSPLWSHDTMKEFGAKLPVFGHSSSPIAYKKSVIVPIGGPGLGVVAFDGETGNVVWKKHDFINVFSSPIVIRVGGEDQLVLLADVEVVGMDPLTGDIKWRHPHENEWKTNICTPIFGTDNMLFISSGGQAGTKALKLGVDGGSIKVEEVWTTKKMAIGQGNMVQVGDTLYGSSGSESLTFVTAANAKDGKVLWRERGFPTTTILHADGKFILLDEDGKLSLATATPEKFTVKTTVELLTPKSWTIPTLVGKRLYVRDMEKIMALDIG